MKSIMPILLLCALCGCGCVSEYQLGIERDSRQAGDKALWRDRKFLEERITVLEKRVYHLERGELLDKPLKVLPKAFEAPQIMLVSQPGPTPAVLTTNN